MRNLDRTITDDLELLAGVICLSMGYATFFYYSPGFELM